MEVFIGFNDIVKVVEEVEFTGYIFVLHIILFFSNI